MRLDPVRRPGPTRPGSLLLRAVPLAMGVLLVVSAGAQPQPPAPAAPEAPRAAQPALEPKAIEILKASSARLAGARTMTFTAVASYENPSLPGPPLVYSTISQVTVQRPDKLRVITPGDGPASEFYYDGKTMTAFMPKENLVAVAPAPPTIEAALEEAYRSAAIYFPFTDAVVADPFGDLAKNLELAFYIGRSRVVGGTTTDMVAYSSHGAFVQIWIGTEDKLPRRARAVFQKDPLRLRHQVEFTNWQLGRPVEAGAFVSARAASAKPIPFAHPDPGPPPDGPAPVGGTPTKPQ
jgi:hypothetical protein